MKNYIIPFCLLTFLLFSCETDSYEKGQGKYSLMTADMGEVTVNSDKQVTAFTTDDGDSYTLTSPAIVQWIQTADTTYRAIIYYNKVENGQAEYMGLASVPTMPRAWLAKNKKYINLGLLFKSGYVEDTMGRHLISVVQDTILVNANQTTTAYYRFLHSQNETPEYFTNRHYVSILLPQERPDTVHLSINTYGGEFIRTFAVK